MVGGFIEAGVMVIIVRIAVALASGEDDVTINLGPLGSVDMTVGQLFGLAFGLLVVRLAFNSINSWLTARLSVEALTAGLSAPSPTSSGPRGRCRASSATATCRRS